MTAAVKAVEDKEYEIFSRYRETRDKKIRDEIVQSYIYIAEILANRFVNKGIEYDDIYQVGCIGLLYAAERFDPDKGVKFASYATPTVMGEIRRYFRDKGRTIKVPRKLYEIFYKAERIRRNNEDTNITEISRILGISDKILEKAYAAGRTAFIESLEDEAYADGHANVADFIGYEDNNFMVIEDCEFIDSCMDRLSEPEREFIRMRYYEVKSQREIAKIMGISPMKVSRMEKDILKKIKNMYFGD
ncbi:MAG: sigma-70 family RNA polymerase sigma factor [Oscillospiraceae bacterium]|nr:sigma-70 family RNA polymerase sigma factor [Oscillospiraceae bacterium]